MMSGDGGRDGNESGGRNGGRDGGRNGGRDDGRNGGDRRDGGDGQRERQGPSVAEKVLTAISIAFTVLLFGFMVWQAVQPPGTGPPRAEVLGTQESPNGSVLVSVELVNSGDAGLISATVEANCSDPPPEATFSYVPAGDRQRGVLVCPPGTTAANVSVSSWVPA